MNKSQYYLSQCADAASKSSMCFTLGAVMVKGGKVISTGHNHHRTHYDGAEVSKHGHRKPVSMHAEMHAIYNLTGMSPSFKTQVQGMERRVLRTSVILPSKHGTKGPKGFKPKVPRHPVGKRRGRRGSRLKTVSSQSSSSSESDSEIGAMSSTSEESSLYCASRDSDRGWSVRRRDPRVNGSDIYVARFTKNGMGTAKPCWRCLEWSRWAGVKRIFHWNAEDNRFEVVKVNSAQREQYETHSDVRLFAGSVSCFILFFP
ncbi:unnamed protein product [Somion occarium]|uniref:CMP/dCMP-type deaminase domain-containing protein n=1 Tax=Somion occarium TaxID=3059160 RepID=A0ABP1CRA6_9APHY